MVQVIIIILYECNNYSFLCNYYLNEFSFLDYVFLPSGFLRKTLSLFYTCFSFVYLHNKLVFPNSSKPSIILTIAWPLSPSIKAKSYFLWNLSFLLFRIAHLKKCLFVFILLDHFSYIDILNLHIVICNIFILFCKI